MEIKSNRKISLFHPRVGPVMGTAGSSGRLPPLAVLNHQQTALGASMRTFRVEPIDDEHRQESDQPYRPHSQTLDGVFS
jgi:hypothetical protein